MYPSLKIQWNRIWLALALLSAMLLLSACTSGGASQPGQPAVAQVTSSQGTATELIPSPTINLPSPESTRDYYATPTPWPGTPPPVITAHAVGQEPTLPPVATIPPEPTLSPTTGTVLLQDEFSSDTRNNYSIVGFMGSDPHSWYVREGVFREDVEEPTYNGSIAITGDGNWSNYTVEADALSYGNTSGLVARYSSSGFYLLHFHCCTDNNGAFHEWSLERVFNPRSQVGYVVIASGPVVSSFRSGQWDHIGLKVEGSTLTAIINGVVEGTISDSTYQTGKAGLFVEQYDTRFADLRITAAP
jgi:hypothetical protein